VRFRAGTILVSVLLLFAVTAQADWCQYTRQETIVTAGGGEWHHVYYEWICYSDGGAAAVLMEVVLAAMVLVAMVLLLSLRL